MNPELAYRSGYTAGLDGDPFDPPEGFEDAYADGYGDGDEDGWHGEELSAAREDASL